eukprot:2786848-Prymnesium_polylepis.1
MRPARAPEPPPYCCCARMERNVTRWPLAYGAPLRRYSSATRLCGASGTRYVTMRGPLRVPWYQLIRR